MIEASHLALFEEDRKEQLYYKNAKLTSKIKLPVTRLGFESLLERALAVYNLPLDDGARIILCGYIHHIPRETNITTIRDIARAFNKQITNGLTTLIYDEIDKKRRAQMQANTQPHLVPDIVETPSSNGSTA